MIDEDKVVNIAWKCIKQHKKEYKKDICEPNHIEVDEVKKKVNRIFVLLLVACLALVGNLVLYSIKQPNTDTYKQLSQDIQKLESTIKSISH